MTGKAGKFDFIPLLITVGSGIGLLAIPTIIADFLLLNATKKRKIYQQLKEYDYKDPNRHEVLANVLTSLKDESEKTAKALLNQNGKSPFANSNNNHLNQIPLNTLEGIT